VASGEWRVASENRNSGRVHGYVLAGGASSRFGFDKAQAELGGETMLQRTCALVAEVARDVIVVAPTGRYAEFDVRSISEAWPGQGPLGGIIGALMDAHAREHRHAWCLIVGCDMPFLTQEWLTYLCERATESGGQVIAPESENGLEPLCACWSTHGTAPLQYAFEGGVRKVTEAMKRLPMEVLTEKHWKRFDTGGRLFWNMNTQADYEEAKRILETERA
jgi:molybdopterin-guanine dinucleotide biosynthesis protein A